MSGDKYHAPRLKEQYKDNAVEVLKNAEVKDNLKKRNIQEKTVEIMEQERCAKK